jgi:hypothetical protein
VKLVCFPSFFFFFFFFFFFSFFVLSSVNSMFAELSDEHLGEPELLQESDGREVSEEPVVGEKIKDVNMRKSLFGRRLSSRASVSEDPALGARPRAASIATTAKVRESVSGWKNKISKRITGGGNSSGGSIPTQMPSEEDVLAQYDAYIYSRGLEDQRSQLDVLSLEAKWNLVREHMAESMEVRQKNKGSASKKDPLKLLQKMTQDPTPSVTDSLRQILSSETVVTQLPKLMEANVVGVLLASLTALEGKPRKTGADQEMLLDILTCLRALIQFPQALAMILDDMNGPLVVIGCFDPSCDVSVRHGALSFLKTLCGGGPSAVLQVVAAWEAYRKTRLERSRFEHLVALFEACSEVQVRLTIAQLVAAMLAGLAERPARVSLRSDLITMGFKTVLKELSENAAIGEELRVKFGDLFDEFVRVQAADERLLATSNRPGRSRSYSIAPEGDVKDLSDSVAKTVGSLDRTNPKASALLRSILESLLTGFGQDDSSFWQWQCCDRLTRMLCSMGGDMDQLSANFDQDVGGAASPETVLANLLLGAVTQDRIQTLREEVFSLREDTAELARAAETTIVDLQAELEHCRTKLKARHHTKRKSKAPIVPGAAAPIAEEASSSGNGSGGSASAGAAPITSSHSSGRLHKSKTLKKKKHTKHALSSGSHPASTASGASNSSGSLPLASSLSTSHDADETAALVTSSGPATPTKSEVAVVASNDSTPGMTDSGDSDSD